MQVEGVEIEYFYFDSKSYHVKNAKVYIVTNCPSVLDNDIVVKFPHDKKYKFVQFVIFHLLSKGQVIINSKGLGDLSNMLKVKHTPNKHWNDSLGWEIVNSINNVLQSTHKVVNIIYFFIYEYIWNDNIGQCFLNFSSS